MRPINIWGWVHPPLGREQDGSDSDLYWLSSDVLKHVPAVLHPQLTKLQGMPALCCVTPLVLQIVDGCWVVGSNVPMWQSPNIHPPNLPHLSGLPQALKFFPSRP